MKLTEKKVRAKVEEILDDNGCNDTEVESVSLPDTKGGAMSVELWGGLVPLNAIAQIGEAWGDKNPHLCGGYIKSDRLMVYILPKEN